MPFRYWLCLAAILSSVGFSASAATVAFLELRWPDGRVVQLDPGGRFAHVAIKVRGKWLHAHTERGVDLVRDIRPYGTRVVYLHSPTVPEPTLWRVNHLLGLPFDTAYRWGVAGCTYCTRLVAELLSVEPKPMTFKSDVWKGMGRPPVGALGLSPDELFNELRGRGFKQVAECEARLASG